MIERARLALQHLWQKRADHHKHRADVQHKGRIPFDRVGVEDRAVMHKPGAVEQDVERPEFVGERRNRLIVGDVEPPRRNQRIDQRG